MNNRHLFILTAVLFAIGLGVFAWRAITLGYPVLPDDRERLWNIEAVVEFEAEQSDVQVELRIPDSPPGFSLWDESFVSRGFSVATTTEADGNRRVNWSSGSADGSNTLYYRTVAGPFEPEPPDHPLAEPEPPPMPDFDEAEQAAADYVMAELEDTTADVPSLVVELTRRLRADNVGDDLALLLGGDTDPAHRIRLTRDLLHFAGIPARLAHAVELPDSGGALAPETWLEAHDADAGWALHEPETGEAVQPSSHLIWWYGDDSPVRVRGGSLTDLSLSANRVDVDAVTASELRGQALAPGLERVSLQNLPVHAQNIYRLLLLVPIGALVLVLMRNFVGIKTFGTFMPILISLAFRETGLLWGVILLLSIVGVGLGARMYLERLHLLAVPRITAVLVVVIMVMAAMSVLSYELGVDQGITIALFPMVILAMTIERMSVVWEERGPGEAFQQAAGSLAVAILAFPVMFNPWVEHLVFVFPELLLAVLAAVLLCGRYTGYRLTEIRRFRAMMQERT